MNHILFLTTNNLATNPRLKKELNLALGSGYRATVLTFNLGNWSNLSSKKIGIELRDRYKVAFELIELDATSETRVNWLFWGLSEKWARKIYPIFTDNVFINALANSRRSIQLLSKVRKLSIQPDLILAHNMGALYPAYCLGKTFKVPFIFDVEDYHPGEMPSSDKDNERKRREFLLRKLLPIAKAITSASPLIGQYTLDLVGGHHNHSVILNSFPESEFNSPITHQSKGVEALKLIWFGQKIGPGRGLEELFQALIEISHVDTGSFLLTLIGEWDAKFKTNEFLSFQEAVVDTSISVEVLQPLSQVGLHVHLSHYDIGLALEPGKDLNNTLALSNKIMTYNQAGLYVLATNTKAQSQFIQECPDRGMLCGQSASEIRLALEILLSNKKAIFKGKETRFKSGRKLGWEREAIKLISLWNDVVKK